MADTNRAKYENPVLEQGIYTVLRTEKFILTERFIRCLWIILTALSFQRADYRMNRLFTEDILRQIRLSTHF